jgi:hypothetical protein
LCWLAGCLFFTNNSHLCWPKRFGVHMWRTTWYWRVVRLSLMNVSRFVWGV